MIDSQLGSAGERKIVLIRMLACMQARHVGLEISRLEQNDFTRRWCETFNLADVARFEQWLRYSGLNWNEFRELMAQLAVLEKIQDHYAEQIDNNITTHLKLFSVHQFVAE